MQITIPPEVKISEVHTWAASLGLEVKYTRENGVELVKPKSAKRSNVRFLRAKTTNQPWPTPGDDGPEVA